MQTAVTRYERHEATWPSETGLKLKLARVNGIQLGLSSGLEASTRDD